MLILGFWEEVGGAIVDAIRSLMLTLCDVVYVLIVFFFDIFMKLGNAKILDEITLNELYVRVGYILGLFMLFRVVFSLIQYVINPDIMLDKQKGIFNIVKKIFIVIILLGTVKPIFGLAFKAQEMIIDSDVIPKVITGKNFNSSAAGADLAWYTFSSFYSFNKIIPEEKRAEICPEFRGDQDSLIKSQFYVKHKLDYAFNCVNEKQPLELPGHEKGYQEYVINFAGNGFIALVVGAFMLYMIVVYTIQVGVRVIQLAYLQLVAPIPIIGYLAPKGEDILKKWVNQCVSTYLDFFIRIAVLYFAVFIIDLIIDNDYNTFVNSLGSVSGWDMAIINVVMIIAILTFAQKVPKLLKELFPSLGGGAAGFNFGLNAKKEILEPLKWGYKSTPLGWAPRALGWTGKKAIGAIDRKIHHLPKPRSKFGQYIDKLAPGAAEVRKNKREAEIDARQWERQVEKGKEMYDRFDGELVYPEGHENAGRLKSGVFKSQAYIDSWNARAEAKGKVKSAQKLINNLNNYITDTQYDTSLSKEEKQRRIGMARLNLRNAEDNLKAAEGELKIAQERHEKNQKIYTKDAEKERLFNNYDDTHKKTKSVNVNDIPDFNVSGQQRPSAQNVSDNELDSQVSAANDGNVTPVNNGDNVLEGQVSMEELLMNLEQEVADSTMNVANTIAKKPGTGAVKEALKEHAELEQRRDEVEEKVQQQTAVEFVDKRRERVDYYSKMYGSYKRAHLEKMQANLEMKDRTTEEEYMLEAIQNLIAKKFQ